ncbi:peritrophin-1-like [Anopheles aquasalis]|uniref:Putative peritrophin-1 n=1 Tax=Anopheles aquasalis TaxID=42839 RepID=T1DQ00_ANOAQ|nr:peritrophin-1-like [Anopheles aquasalis]
MVLVLGFSLLTTLLASSADIVPAGCPAVHDGLTHHLAHPKRCGQYIVCAGKRKIEQSCPNGFQWNALESTCTLVPATKDAKCSSRDGRSLADGVVSAKCPAKLDRCPLETNPTEEVILLPHPDDCRKFYACVSTVPIELNCPKGLYWHHGSCRCDYERPTGDGKCGVDGGEQNAGHRRRARDTEEDDGTTTTETPVLESGAHALKALSSILLLIGTLALNH